MFSKITEFRILPGNFSFRWMRPSAVWMMDKSGHEQVIKINDPTRQILLSMAGLVTVGTTLLWVLKLTNLRLKRA